MSRKKPVIQTHHIRYGDNPLTVVVYQGEHLELTRLGWRKRISKGFIKALRIWIEENKDKAINLFKEKEMQIEYFNGKKEKQFFPSEKEMRIAAQGVVLNPKVRKVTFVIPGKKLRRKIGNAHNERTQTNL